MPIIVKDFTWNQTESTIIIIVPLKGVHQSKVNVFTSEKYIKANYEQFFFEVLLLESVDIKASKCTLTSKEIVFELVKNVKTSWESLEPNLSKQEKLKLKLQLIDEQYEKIQKESEELAAKKSELKRVAVNEQIKIDSKIREQIENVKKKEQEKALGDIKTWKKAMKKNKANFTKFISANLEEHNVEKIIELPSVRNCGELQVDFTERIFPTPLRESKTEEENVWLAQQAEARKSVGFISEDIRPEEKNPQFLLRKGDEFMKNSNYLGAISAYSFGIKLSEKFVDLYIARSKAHYLQGNNQKCAVDCSTALELMVPEVQSNLEQRAECIGRRGMALCKLKMLSKGIDELEASLKLYPNEEFKKFLQTAEREWMNNSDSD